MAKLTTQQQLFVVEYLKDLNATQAAIRAGYSKKTARQQGSRLLSNVDIQNAITQAKQDRIDEVKIDANYVLQKLFSWVEIDPIDLFDDNHELLPLTEWPKEARQYLGGIDVSVTEAEVIKKVRFPDKLKTIEALGRHIDVQAFREAKTVDTTVTGELSIKDKYKDASLDEINARINELQQQQ